MSFWGQLINYITIGRVIWGLVLFKLRMRWNKTLKKIGRGKYEVVYYINDQVYRFRTQMRRGPSKITCIRNRQWGDITEDIRSYLGPNEDCHGQQLTPMDIGYDGIFIFFRGNVGGYISSEESIDITKTHERTRHKLLIRLQVLQ